MGCIERHIENGRVVKRDCYTGAVTVPTPTYGPGTELKRILHDWFRIEASANCSCNSKARRMDAEEARNPGWCEEHIDEIVGWLRDEAKRRKLPFFDVAGRILVRRAIHNAKRAAAKSGLTQ